MENDAVVFDEIVNPVPGKSYKISVLNETTERVYVGKLDGSFFCGDYGLKIYGKNGVVHLIAYTENDWKGVEYHLKRVVIDGKEFLADTFW